MRRHVYYHHTQWWLAARYPSAGGLSRERQSQDTHLGQPLEAAGGGHRRPASDPPGQADGLDRRGVRDRRRRFTSPRARRGRADRDAASRLLSTNQLPAIASARLGGGDGGSPHPQPPVETGHDALVVKHDSDRDIGPGADG